MSQAKIHVGHRPTQRKQLLFWIVTIILVIFSVCKINFDWSVFTEGLKKIPTVLSKMVQISWEVVPKVLESMLLTLAIALIGIVISAILALVIGFLIAGNTAPSKIVKNILSSICIIIRTIPIAVWVLLAVASAGFGATAAVLGLALPTMAYLSKTFANQIETCGKDIKETMVAQGTSWPVMIVRGFIPTCKASLLAVAAFRFEMSVSESTVLGLIGCGGIGYLISRYIKAYKFGELSVCLIVVLIVMYALELGTTQIRKKMRNEKSE